MEVTTAPHIELKTYSDNLYLTEDDSRYDNYLYFTNTHISSVVTDPVAKQVMQLTVLTTGNASCLELTYDELKSLEPLMELVQKKFRQRKVIISDDHCTLLPESLLNIVETQPYYQTAKRLLPNSQVLDCKMHVQRTACIYNVRNELLKLIRFSMRMVDMYHASLLFIKAIEQQQFDLSVSKLHVNLHKGFIEVLNLDKQLKFYNTFRYVSNNEIVYFILAVARQLELAQDAEVLLYGRLDICIDLMPQLTPYVKSVRKGIKPKNFTYPVAFNQFDECMYVLEASALLCE